MVILYQISTLCVSWPSARPGVNTLLIVTHAPIFSVHDRPTVIVYVVSTQLAYGTLNKKQLVCGKYHAFLETTRMRMA